MFWIWTLFFEEGGRLERDSIVISSFDHLPMGKGGFSVAEMPCDIISLVKVPGRKNRQWTGVVSLSSRRLLPTVFLTLVILEVVMAVASANSWHQLESAAQHRLESISRYGHRATLFHLNF